MAGNREMFQDKGIIPGVAAGYWYFTLCPNYDLDHVLAAWEAAGCTLLSLNTDFRAGRCRYFFQVGMNLSIELQLCHTHLLKAVTLKRASVHVFEKSCSYSLLFIWIYPKVHNVKNRNIWCALMIFKLLYVFCCFIENKCPLTSVMVNKSKSFIIVIWVAPMPSAFLSVVPLPGGERCDAVSQNDFREAARAWYYNSIFSPSLSLSLSLSLTQMKRQVLYCFSKYQRAQRL